MPFELSELDGVGVADVDDPGVPPSPGDVDGAVVGAVVAGAWVETWAGGWAIAVLLPAGVGSNRQTAMNPAMDSATMKIV
ncbi:MAG TPA: hypothetical protein VJX66_25730, partial [Amycolatopsis sp.]|nr:hypothetical protein [Amycolatopsis sp.]